MNTITFKDIYTPGRVKEDNTQFIHIHDPEMLIRYDSNFIKFKQMPSVVEFMDVENHLRNFHQRNGQKHLKFYFPANEKPPGSFLDYLNQSDYETGFLELYAIKPADFPAGERNAEISIKFVSENTFAQFLELQYGQEKGYGEEFAEQKLEEHKRNYSRKHIQQVIAFYGNQPAGSVDIILNENTAEIDSLYVHEDFRKKGIGAQLQKFVMDSFPDSTVILVADGEDTPREMYQKQNYTYIGFQYETLKVVK
ncbi:GNAT family N-acetyltransferase [Virgibacillus kekensis]|uniref:GNAT family N-acetyltransferase n=1 Tax=Virgibacillus kekensis TaxID=202261 RepID=A0ABV9DHH4_9BACI